MVRSLADLEQNAEHFWPSKLAEREQEISVIPRLIESQEKFIGILYVADTSPTAWVKALKLTKGMPGNLFLKHLMILTDIGNEKLQRYRTNLNSFFPEGIMHYVWQEKSYSYRFQAFDKIKKWDNSTLAVDGKGLAKILPLQPVHKDVAMLLMHGEAAVDANVPDDIVYKCMVGTLLGNKEELDSFVRQRYIHVSRITGGATANTMGQLCEAFVKEYLQTHLPDWNFSARKIPGISQNAGKTDISFDIVGQSPARVYCAVEVSFQVTTNSTIERKTGQARARQQLLHQFGHRIAYVIDGAGNFQRSSTISTICANADCVVTFREDELLKLVDYLRSLTNSAES